MRVVIQRVSNASVYVDEKKIASELVAYLNEFSQIVDFFEITSTTVLMFSSSTRISSLILGNVSTEYSAPLYISVCPFCLP